jgi:hypothetical protein
MPYVLGDGGDIVAILWADHAPLVAPPATDRNKILWVAQVSSGGVPRLRIPATLRGGHRTVRRTLEGGPGPSAIDMPAVGCWSFDLRYSYTTSAGPRWWPVCSPPL